MKKYIFALITIILALFTPLPVGATANDFYFDSATYDFYLSKNSDNTSNLKVKEELVAVFPETNQNHGITRVIPYTNQDGKNLTMSSATNLNISVTRNGQPENIAKVENESNAFIVYIGSSAEYVHGRQTYVLEYEFQNVITDFDAYQELYWDTNGIGWSQTFNTLTANLHFENVEAPAITDAWCYVGAKGSNNQTRCDIATIPDGLSFTTTDLRAGENLTFDVQFPAGTFTIGKSQKDYTFLIVTILFAIISASLIIFLICDYLQHGRPERLYYKNLPTPVQYTPLANISAAELATIYLKKTKDPKVATLLELAVNHKIEIIQQGKKDWLIRIKDLNITSTQFQVLQIFAGESLSLNVEDTIPIEKDKTNSPTRNLLISTFVPKVKQSLIQKGLLNEKTRSLPSILFLIYTGIVICLIAVLPSILSQAEYLIAYEQYLWPITIGIGIFTFVISAWINLSLISKYSEYTTLGLDAANYAAGLKEYIGLAEKDRLAFNQSTDGAPKDASGTVRLYECLLPYAALFGLEKSWLKQLQTYYDKDPDLIPAWYIGTTHFNSRDFSSALTSFNTSISSMASSSSTSGSAGGGFSGGGGGGGGGGGW